MAASVQRASALQLPLQVALAAALAACAAPRPPPAAPAAHAIYTDDAAFELAQRLLLAFGYDQLRHVAQIDFRQVYYADDVRIFATEHHWDLVNQRDRMVWTETDGHTYDAVLHLQTGIAYGYVDGAEAVGPAQANLTARARQRFAADTRYLVMPMRLLDPSAHLVLGGPERVDGQTFEVLELLSEGPDGPTVRLFVDPAGLRVLRSETASNADPRTAQLAHWGDYRPAGPPLLPPEVRLGGLRDRTTRLEDVAVRRAVDHRGLLPAQAR